MQKFSELFMWGVIFYNIDEIRYQCLLVIFKCGDFFLINPQL